SEEVLAVHEALKTLEQDNSEAAELVQLRFFGGMTVPEAAAIMGISEAAAKRLWPYAKAKLAVIISEE
ncbi:MAG: ECF-type sigma factor, partial [Verrucomicrobiota bacterium]